MATMRSVLTFQYLCPQSQEQLELEREKYFNWGDTYQNPLSQAYKNVRAVPASKSILFHVGLRQNWSLRALTQDPNHQSPTDDIIIPGADLKLDADFSYKLYQQVDLTTPYYYDYITFSIKAPGHQVNPDGFIDVFSSGLWLWLFLSATVCTGVIHGVSFSFITRRFELNFRHSLAFILKTFFIEGHDLKHPKPAVQVLASVWALGAFVTSTMYLSLVVSSVLSPYPPPPMPETLEDISKLGMKTTTLISQYKDVMSFLEGSESKALQNLALNLSTVEYTVNCQDAAVRDTTVACVAKFRGMQTFLESKYTDKNGNRRILISKYRSPIIWTGYAFRKNSPYRGIISDFISRTTAAGLVGHWTNTEYNEFRRWGVGMGLGDQCSNQPHLFELWGEVGKEANKDNPNKHIPSCFRYNLKDYIEIVKKNCIKIETGASGNSGSLDSMLRVEHLFIVFEAMIFWYSLAFVCFILELVCARLYTSFGLQLYYCCPNCSICFFKVQ